LQVGGGIKVFKPDRARLVRAGKKNDKKAWLSADGVSGASISVAVIYGYGSVGLGIAMSSVLLL